MALILYCLTLDPLAALTGAVLGLAVGILAGIAVRFRGR